MGKSNIFKKAELELATLCKTYPTQDNPPIIKGFIPEILAVVDKFGRSGQSGSSAPYTASSICSALKHLLLQEPICPITGTDEEFGVVSDGLCQNKRCYSIFKQLDSDRAYYLDAITWKNQHGRGYSGPAILSNGKRILSRQYIKSFPFTPKTFVIDVIEREISKDNWEFYVKDENQLIDVFEYYDVY